MPPTFILESSISLSVAEKNEDYFYESIIRLPIRDKSFSRMYEKKVNEYAFAKDKHAGLYGDSAKKGLSFLQRVGKYSIMDRNARVGRELANKWLAGPDTSNLWSEIKNEYSAKIIDRLCLIPGELYERGLAVTWASINKVLNERNIVISEYDLQRAHLKYYNKIYQEEYCLVEIVNLPYFRGAIDHCCAVEYFHIKNILKAIGLYDFIVSASCHQIIEIRDMYAHKRFIRSISILLKMFDEYWELQVFWVKQLPLPTPCDQ